MHLRKHSSSPRLVRVLGGPGLVDAGAARQDIAERLGPWVDAFDAMSLQAAHQSIKAMAACPPAGAQLPGAQAQFQRVREALARGIAAGEDAAAHEPPTTEFAPWRKRYAEQQRHMELKIGPLRAQVRQALSRGSLRLRQLAVLDAVLEQTFAAREQKLLSTVPMHLERRFAELRARHLGAIDPAAAPDDPATWRVPGAWLDVFGRHMRDALLAELDARLQPVAGLIDALRSDYKEDQ